MSIFNIEPKRETDINLLWAPFRARVEKLLAAMKRRGFDPVVFESVRTLKRQQWLYGYGRTHHKGNKPKTWTMASRHIPGKAVDIISKKYYWNYPPFFAALRQEAEKLDLQVLDVEQCHVQWGG